MTPQEKNILEELTGPNQLGFNLALIRANEKELLAARETLNSKLCDIQHKFRECQSMKQSNVYLMTIQKMDLRIKLITNRLL